MGLLDYLSRNAPWLSAGALLTFLSSFGQTFFISIFAGEIRGEFGLSHGEWGGIYSMGTMASAVVMIWAGTLTDVFRVRAIGPVVLLGLALACLAMGLNTAVWFLPVVIFALRLFGQGMSSHIASVAMTRWFVATRGRALAIAAMGFAFGEAVLPLLFVSAMTVLVWRDLWLISAAISLAGILPLLLLLRKERTPQSLAQETSSVGMNGKSWTRRAALMHPLFWFLVPAILGPAAFNTAFFFHQVHIAEIKGWTHFDLVALFPAYTLTATLMMIASGWALDRWGTARIMPWTQVPIAIAFVILSLSQGLGGGLIAILFMALTTGANATVPIALLAEFYGTAHIGSIKALAAAIMVLGSAIGPGITGFLIDVGIGLETQFLAISAWFLVATALMVFGIGQARRSLVA